MKKLVKNILLAFIILLFVVGCTNDGGNVDSSDTEDASVVTSIYPVYEIVNEIAGERLDVSLMVGENEDAHHYEPSAQAVASVNEADVFIYSSDIMEFWAEDLFSVVENDDLLTIEMAENLDLALGGAEEDTGHNHNYDHDDETHAHDVEQSVTIEGVAGHYHTGDLIELTATNDSDYDHWHWFVREPDSDEWEMVEGQLSDTFSSEAIIDGQEIKAELYDDEHNLIAESEPLTIVIDDHDEETHNHDVEQSVITDGIAGHYHTGDLVELTATHDSDYDHWHWFIREPDSDEWEVVEGQLSENFSGVATTDGQEIKAELYDDEHNLIAESEPLTVVIDDHEGENSHDHNHESETLDPHFWLDPLAVNDVLPVIVDALSEVDPAGAEIYQENANAFSEALVELDNAYQEAFDGASNRAFVVQHQAFGHLAERYDLEQVSVGGMITEIEPNPESIVNVTEFVQENDIPIIYYQSGESSSTAETIANETDTEIATLYDLESRPTEDNFEENVYIEAMYHNLDQLQKSIQ